MTTNTLEVIDRAIRVLRDWQDAHGLQDQETDVVCADLLTARALVIDLMDAAGDSLKYAGPMYETLRAAVAASRGIA